MELDPTPQPPSPNSRPQWTLSEGDLKSDLKSDFALDQGRSKTSLRMHYEAQVEVLKKQVGDLEDIRIRLNLTQRKICQLLMVDPSAWSRWSKEKSTPPHIYRALHWYLILQEKLPGLTPQYFTGRDPEVLHQQTLREIRHETEARQKLENEKLVLMEKVLALEKQVQATRVGFFMLVLAALILALTFALKMRS